MSTSNLFVSITVDWEGEHFRDLGDLQTTRAAIEVSLGARVPFTHYICPTYWLGALPHVDPARAIRSVVRKGDELALHVHGWRELVERAGLRFLSEPDWNGDGTGHGVPLGVYGSDVGALLATARTLLERKLGATVWGFRCGGAMTSDRPSPPLSARWASIVGVLPRPMSSARQPPSSTEWRKRSHATASAW